MHSSNKYIFSILLLIGLFLFGAHYLRYQHDIVLEKDGYQLIKIGKAQTISPHKEPIVFIVKEGKSKRAIYKFNGYEKGDFSSIDLHCYKTDSIQEDDYYFIDGFKNNLPFQKKYDDLEFESMYDIVHSGKAFEARQLIQHTLEPGIQGYIDTMPLIFVVLGFFLFVVFKLVNGLEFLANKIQSGKVSKYIVHGIVLLLILFLSSMVRLVPWFPISPTASLIRNAFIIIPVYIAIHWVSNEKYSIEEFWKKQLIIFSIILIGGNVLRFLGNKFTFIIDQSKFEKIWLKPFFCTYDSLAIGFLFAVALGLVLKNVFNLKLNDWKEKRAST